MVAASSTERSLKPTIPERRRNGAAVWAIRTDDARDAGPADTFAETTAQADEMLADLQIGSG
jgi:hypothetical protein